VITSASGPPRITGRIRSNGITPEPARRKHDQRVTHAATPSKAGSACLFRVALCPAGAASRSRRQYGTWVQRRARVPPVSGRARLPVPPPPDPPGRVPPLSRARKVDAAMSARLREAAASAALISAGSMSLSVDSARSCNSASELSRAAITRPISPPDVTNCSGRLGSRHDLSHRNGHPVGLVRPNAERAYQLRAVADLATREVKRDRETIEVRLEMDFARETTP
jgi:hypothetical protein